MRSASQKILAGKLAKAGKKRVKLDYTKLGEIKESITKADIRSLIENGIITIKQKKGVSRFWAKKRQAQRRKGRQKGFGSVKSKINARISKKDRWMGKIRAQRKFLVNLKEKQLIDKKIFRMLYLKSKGGFFRNIRHIKIYIEEHNLIPKKEKI